MNMTGCPPLLELYNSYDQWKDEHDALKANLLELCRLLTWNPTNFDYADWDGFHRQIRSQFVTFFKDWELHQERERRMIHPVAKPCAGGQWLPVAVLEKERRLAEQFFLAYLEKAGTTAEEALISMQQVLMLLTEHFRVEEESVIPATEKLLEQIEYSAL